MSWGDALGRELTLNEQLFVQNLEGLAYVEGDVLYHDGSNLNRLGVGANGEVLTVVSGLPLWAVGGGGGGGAPTNAQYVALAINATLTDERLLTGTDNQIVITDNGAGNTVVLSLPQDLHTAATPTFSDLILSSFVQGSILFAGAGGAISEDNSNFYWDYTSNFLRTPKIVGGISTNQDLTFQTTTGVGASGADMHFLVGNNGATEAITILNNGSVGIGTTSSSSTLHTAGSFAHKVVNKIAAYTATDETVILCDATSAAFTITLPAAANSTDRTYHIKKIDNSANTITVDGNASETIDGALTQVITIQYDSIQIVCDGSLWYII